MHASVVTWLIFCCVFLLGMGGTMKQSPDDYRAQLQRIDLSDGVSKEEAIIIAQNYLIGEKADKEFVLSRPRVSDSKLIEGCWRVSFPRALRETLEHGPLWSVVDIDKKTGQIKSFGGWPDL